MRKALFAATLVACLLLIYCACLPEARALPQARAQRRGPADTAAVWLHYGPN